jgi:hypothetical protein
MREARVTPTMMRVFDELLRQEHRSARPAESTWMFPCRRSSLDRPGFEKLSAETKKAAERRL